MDDLKKAMAVAAKDAVTSKFSSASGILPPNVVDVEVQDVSPLLTRIRVRTRTGIRYFDMQFRESM